MTSGSTEISAQYWDGKYSPAVFYSHQQVQQKISAQYWDGKYSLNRVLQPPTGATENPLK